MAYPTRSLRRAAIAGLLVLAAILSPAVAGDDSSVAGGDSYVPAIDELRATESEMRAAVERYTQDYWTLRRRYDADVSPEGRRVWRRFHDDWNAALDAADYEAYGVEGRIDWHLLKNRVAYELRQLDREAERRAETDPLLPFAATIVGLGDALGRMEAVDPQAAAATLTELEKRVAATRQALERGLSPDGDGTDEPRLEATKTVAHRAAQRVDGLQRTLAAWHQHYDSYDPLFTWWAKSPYEKAAEALESYATFLRQRIVGVRDGEDPPIVGDPIGRDALLDDLAQAMIAYTPEELIEIGRREMEWCQAEMLEAARELGYGDDWKAALEHVKTLHVAPGEQPELIRRQGFEAIGFLESRDLLTLPPLAKDIWQVHMISPEKQKVNPFFFFSQNAIWVSFPTTEMTHEQKLMSLRGNNIHFARATVHHELIPGHHLQSFMTSRYNSHRQMFSTPFWTEGWALYWEMVLWDLGFPETPENKIGMLFWRMHRCARIIFSLSFHLGEMTPQEAIDLLVDDVGHELDNATAEVRRSFEGSYSPLYQIAYMIGALQFRALAAEVVGAGEMPEREFHDAVLRGGNMPIELVRARIKGERPGRDFKASWRFAD